MAAILEKHDLRDFDWLTSILALAIAAFGVWQIHNALPSEGYWSKQFYGIGISVVAILLVSFTVYRRLIVSASIFFLGWLILLFLILTTT